MKFELCRSPGGRSRRGSEVIAVSLLGVVVALALDAVLIELATIAAVAVGWIR
jgi:hypothetical protein